MPPPVHGSTLMTRILLESLDKSGLEATVLQRQFSKDVREIGKFSVKKLISAGYLVLRLLAALAKRPSVVIFFVTTRKLSFVVDVIMATLLRLAPVYVIGYAHMRGFSQLADTNRMYSMSVRWLLQSCGTIVCLSRSLEYDIEPLVGQKTQIVNIPNTVTDLGPTFRTNEGRDEKQVVFLSNLLPDKGIDTFVELAVSLKADGLKVNCVAAGAPVSGTQLDELRGRAGDSVNFIGAVTGLAKTSLLSNADLIVFPSRDEAQPLVILEAMNFGIPVVAYAVGGIPDLIVNHRTGVLINPGDSGELINQVRLLLHDVTKLSNLGKAAQALYNSEYSRSRYRERWDALIRSIRVLTD